MKGNSLAAIVATVFVTILSTSASAQSGSFSYQGRLQDGGTNANGNYDFQFTLWDAVSGGTQQPQPSPVTVTKTSVAVSNGVFIVQLDFGATAFPGANRWLETSARLAGGGSFTLLSPRQPITSTPYAIRAQDTAAADSLSSACSNCVQSAQINSVAGAKVVGIVASATDATNAFQLGGVPANNYVLTSDSRLTDSRPPAPGSSNYIQNTTSKQSSSSFNVSGSSQVGGTLVAGTQDIPIVFSAPPNLKLIVTGGAAVLGNSLFNTSGTNGVRITPVSDQDNGILNVTNAANTKNWLTVSGNGRVIMDSTISPGPAGQPEADPKLAITGNVKITSGLIETNSVAAGSSTIQTCWTTSFASAPFVLGICPSSLRYKTKVQPFVGGLDLINRLHPITFTWKQDGVRDIGLGAEDVEQIEPLLTFRNPKGEIEGVRYDHIGVVLINAIKEQQTQISAQQDQIMRDEIAIKNQQQQLNALKKLVCRSHRRASVCR